MRLRATPTLLERLVPQFQSPHDPAALHPRLPRHHASVPRHFALCPARVSPRRGLPTDLRASVMIGPCIVYRHAIQWDQ